MRGEGKHELGSDFMESLDIVGKPLKLSYSESSHVQLRPLVGPVKLVLHERCARARGPYY